MRKAILVILTLISVSGAARAADPPRILAWADLVPAAASVQDPFGDRDEAVRNEIAAAYRNRKDIEQGFIKEDTDAYAEAMALEKRLSAAGIDIDEVVRRVDDAFAAFEEQRAMTVPELDGKTVRIPGYALPLEFNEVGVTEFLLVPYVGACIHTPPPPPNQMVFVTVPEPYIMQSLYEPVWITGTIETKAGSHALYFVDGQADIDVGYAITGQTIEPYKWEK